MVLPPELLDIIVCPRCKGALRLEQQDPALVCATCRLKFPVRDDIPVMLVDEAETIG